MANRSDILVVGGGIFGVTAARELRRRGHAVTLIDPGPLPARLAASTDISKVVRMEYGADALYMELGEQSRLGWLGWNEAWGEALYHDVGVFLPTRRRCRRANTNMRVFSCCWRAGTHPSG